MKQKYKYSFAKRMKLVCPQCGRRTFVPYVDNATGAVLNSGVGKCDRANHCAYHYTPSEFFEAQGIQKRQSGKATERLSCPPISKLRQTVAPGHGSAMSLLPAASEPAERRFTPSNPQNLILRDLRDLRGGKEHPSTLPMELVMRSMQGDYANNVLIGWILARCTELWGAEEAQDRVFRAVAELAIGNTRDGDCVFWQIAPPTEVRTGKIMRYTADGHRDHARFGTWVHALLHKKDFELRQCLFGLHQIQPGGTTPIAIVESEKSALIASIFCPEKYLWMATGGCHNLKEEFLAPLKGRDIRLFPDLGQFESWSAIAQQLNGRFEGRITVDTTLERVATEQDRTAGLDLADYLMRFASQLKVQKFKAQGS